MARKRCKCKGGTYRYACCRSTKRSNKARTSSSSNKKRRRDGGRDGDPIDVALDRLRRRGYVYMAGSVITGGLYGVALVAESLDTPHGATGSYGKGSGKTKPVTKAAQKRARRRAVVKSTAFGAARVTGRVATRGIPVVGTVLLAYDLYTVVDWAIGGRMPYGARDRR